MQALGGRGSIASPKIIQAAVKIEKKHIEANACKVPKLSLQIKNIFVGGGLHTIFSTDPLIPSYATADELA
jgi:hypothetical protein